MYYLGRSFRKSFVRYLKNPDDAKIKQSFIDSAFAIYEEAEAFYGLEPDKYIPYVHNIVKPATDGIKTSPEIAKRFDQLLREVSFSDTLEENRAFHVLNVAYGLTTPKKSCLRELIQALLALQNKLAEENIIITNRNSAGSFFLNTSDVMNIRAKKSVVDHLIQSISNDVFSKSVEDGPRFFPIFCGVKKRIQCIGKHIDTLTEKQCEQLLSRFLQKVKPMLSAQANTGEIRDDAEYMTDAGKRSALMIHSFNDQWFFNFLAKLMKSIQETLGVKTTAEKVLEGCVDKINRLGIQDGPTIAFR